MKKVNKIPYRADLLSRYISRYLERFDASSKKLYTFLLNKVKKNCILEEVHIEEVQSDIREVIQRYKQIGAIDDVKLAYHRLKSLLRDGHPYYAAQQKLLAQGLTLTQIDQGWQELCEQELTSNSKATLSTIRQETPIERLELYALCKYAKKKKLLLWQIPEQDEEKAKLMASRRGFCYSLISEFFTTGNLIYTEEKTYEELIRTVEIEFDL